MLVKTEQPTEQPAHAAEVGREECLALLAATALGRIAVNAPGWPPVIRPVTYIFDARSQSVVFGSAAGSKLTTLLRSERAAFEIDGVDPADHTGWSVIVVGPVEEITSATERERLGAAGLGGEFPHLMRIRATVVSGRRIALRG